MAGKILTAEQFEDIVRKAVRAEFERVGLRIETDDHADAAAEDFRFIRRWRQAIEGVSAKVGMAVILAVIGGATTALWQGFKLLAGK